MKPLCGCDVFNCWEKKKKKSLPSLNWEFGIVSVLYAYRNSVNKFKQVEKKKKKNYRKSFKV